MESSLGLPLCRERVVGPSEGRSGHSQPVHVPSPKQRKEGMTTPGMTAGANGTLTCTLHPERVSGDSGWILISRKHCALLTRTCPVSPRDQELPAALKDAVSEGSLGLTPHLLSSRSSQDGQV